MGIRVAGVGWSRQDRGGGDYWSRSLPRYCECLIPKLKCGVLLISDWWGGKRQRGGVRRQIVEKGRDDEMWTRGKDTGRGERETKKKEKN